MRNKKYKLIFATAILAPAAANAAVCAETIVQLINHSNGNVYFSSDQTCASGWCQINGNADFVKRGYAMLMAAQTSGKKITFLWPALATCGQNQSYASPEYMWMN